MTLALEVPQPFAWLIVTGQVDCFPGAPGKPPQEACGQRVSIVATALCRVTLRALEDHLFAYPAPKSTEDPETGLWRRDPAQPLGRLKNEKGARVWVANPKANAKVYPVKFPLGPVGTACLDGWLQMEGRTVVAQYRPEGTPQSNIKLHRVALGPYCWVLRRPQTWFTLERK